MPRTLHAMALLLACLVIAPDSLAGSKKAPPLTLRVHCEGTPTDGSSFVTDIELADGRKISIRKVPAVNERDITAFHAFPGIDGLAGAYFRLDAHGANKLQQLTIEDRGRTAVVLVNGRVASAMKITGTVNDGILYVPGGLLPQEIATLERRYPMIGRESEFGKKKRQPKPESAQ